MQKFQKIAELRNPEEFYFKMQSTKVDRQNKVVLKEDEGFDKDEFQTLLKTQNLSILKMKAKSLRNQIERMKADFQLRDSSKLKVFDLDTGKEENN